MGAAGPGDGAPSRWSARSLADLVWLSLVPALLVLAAAMFLLGRPLGRALFPANVPGVTFWRWEMQGIVQPEPTEHARYLLALAVPLALCAGIVLAGRWAWSAPAPGRVARPLAWATQALVPPFLVGCLLAQRAFAYGRVYFPNPPQHVAFFSWTTLVVAAGLAALLALLPRRRALVARVVAALRETPRLRLAAGALAVLFTADWALTAFNTEGTIGLAHHGVRVTFPLWLDETFAVLDGRTPLVNFDPQYGHLWPYLAAGPMALFGADVGVYTAVLALGTVLALLAVYATLRRVTRSSAAALALYLPFVATGFFMEIGPLANRYGPSTLLTEFPMRYAGPYLLAWLTARRLDGARPRTRALLFLVGGLVAVNNLEFGLPAVAAVLAAELWASERLTRRAVLLLGRDALAGLAGAAALLSLVTLVAAGEPPRFGTLLIFPRMYGLAGFGMMPIPPAGFHLVVYATFVAALVFASFRVAAGREDRLLTGMLAWSGAFGLGAGGYFVGRSHPEVLIDLFSTWSLALSLLLVAGVRELRRRPGARPSPAWVALLAAFGLTVCSLAQTPTPWSQAARLSRTTAVPAMRNLATERFVASGTRPGEPVAILAALGHRVAYDLGLPNVSPWAGIEAVLTVQQLDETIARLRAAGGTRLYVDYSLTKDEVIARIAHDGFVARRESPNLIIEYVDARAGRTDASRR